MTDTITVLRSTAEEHLRFAWPLRNHPWTEVRTVARENIRQSLKSLKALKYRRRLSLVVS